MNELGYQRGIIRPEKTIKNLTAVFQGDLIAMAKRKLIEQQCVYCYEKNPAMTNHCLNPDCNKPLDG